jgi:hypothetical protein
MDVKWFLVHLKPIFRLLNLFGANALDRWRMPINAHRRAPVHNPNGRKRPCLRGRVCFSLPLLWNTVFPLYDLHQRERFTAFGAHTSDRTPSRPEVCDRFPGKAVVTPCVWSG